MYIFKMDKIKNLKESQMTKKALVALLTAELTAVLTPMLNKPLNKDGVDNIIDVITTKVGPQAGGGASKLNIADITKVENGKTVQIFDTVAKIWLPATKEFFYEEKKNPVEAMNGLKNHSKAREKVTKEHVKHAKAAKDLVWKASVENDNLLSKEVCKQILSEIPAIDYKRINPKGVVESNQAIAKFEAKIEELTGKVDAAIKAKAEQKA